MTWWMWMLVGFACLVLELLTPGGIFMIFFGVAGLLVGLMVVTGIGGPVWFQALAFSVLSVVSLLTLRGPILRRMSFGGGGEIDSLVGQEVVLLAALTPGGVSKAELRGTVWEARTASRAPLRKGARCRVERVAGLSLWVQPLQEQPAGSREGESR